MSFQKIRRLNRSDRKLKRRERIERKHLDKQNRKQEWK